MACFPVRLGWPLPVSAGHRSASRGGAVKDGVATAKRRAERVLDGTEHGASMDSQGTLAPPGRR
jgi:hypothetical protein